MLALGPRAAPAILKAVEHPNEKVRTSALTLITAKKLQIDPEVAVACLVKALKDRSARVRGHAARELQYGGPQARAAVPALLEALKDRAIAEEEFENRVCHIAFFTLRWLGPAAKSAVPVFLELLNDEDWGMRAKAAGALGTNGSKCRGVVPALIRCLKDPELRVRNSAACALIKLGAESKPAVPALIEVLQDHQQLKTSVATNLCMNIVEGLGLIAPESKEIVPVLARVVKDRQVDQYVRYQAVETLGTLGKNAEAAIPILLEASKEDDFMMSREAKDALARIRQDISKINTKQQEKQR